MLVFHLKNLGSVCYTVFEMRGRPKLMSTLIYEMKLGKVLALVWDGSSDTAAVWNRY